MSHKFDIPIFVVGLTWRNGTTALQRMLNASGEIFVWGEPWPSTHRLQQLRQAYQELENGERASEVLDKEPKDLSKSWTATVQPSSSDFIGAVQVFYHRYFGSEISRREIPRWGIKEVHLGKEDLDWLSILFPESPFVILHRNPIDSWLSYINAHRGYGRGWRQPNSNEPIRTANEYVNHWNSRAKGILEFYASHQRLVKLMPFHELQFNPELILGETFEFCDLSTKNIRQSLEASKHKLGNSSDRAANYSLRDQDKDILIKQCSSLAEQFGYQLTDK